MTQRDKKRIKRYFQRTWKNKLLAIACIATGFASTFEGDCTWLIFMIILGITLFFYREDIFKEYDE